MEDNLVIFCSLEDGFEDMMNESNNKSVICFLNLLEQKRIEENCDKVTLCFISNNKNGKYIEKYFDFLKGKINSDRIIMGIQYFPCGFINNNGNNSNRISVKELELFDFIDLMSSQLFYDFTKVPIAIYMGSYNNINKLKEKVDKSLKFHDLDNGYQGRKTIFQYYKTNDGKESNFKNTLNIFQKNLKQNLYTIKNNNPKKENILLFFMDIQNTIDMIDEISAEKLKKVLEEKMVAHNASKVVISLVTNDESTFYIKTWNENMKKFISNQNIIIGDSFYLDGMIINDNLYKNEACQNLICDIKDPETSWTVPNGSLKADKIIYYINKISQKYNIMHICYGDDSLSQESYSILKNLIPCANLEVDFYCLPDCRLSSDENILYFKEWNILGLIGCIKESLEKNIIYLDKETAKKEQSNDISYQMKPPKE